MKIRVNSQVSSIHSRPERTKKYNNVFPVEEAGGVVPHFTLLVEM